MLRTKFGFGRGFGTSTGQAVVAVNGAPDSFEVVAPLNVDEEEGGEVYRGGGSGFGGLVVLGGLGRVAESILAYRTDAVTQQDVPLIGESVRPLASARIGV